MQVAFNGLDRPPIGDGPDFVKALEIDHALDGEVMLAWRMNGAELPFLNGYPLRLVVPGYFGTYWIKHLSDIQVLAQGVRRLLDGQRLSHPRQRVRVRRARHRAGGNGADRPVQRPLVHHQRARRRDGSGGPERRDARHRVRRRAGHLRGRVLRGRRRRPGNRHGSAPATAATRSRSGPRRSARSGKAATICRCARPIAPARPSRRPRSGIPPATCATSSRRSASRRCEDADAEPALRLAVGRGPRHGPVVVRRAAHDHAAAGDRGLSRRASCPATGSWRRTASAAIPRTTPRCSRPPPRARTGTRPSRR